MISKEEFIARQHRLLSLCEPESVCVIPAGQVLSRSRDTEFPFRQNSDFWYLTGFNEPDGWLLLSNHSQFSDPYRAMVFRPNDKQAEIWQGRRLGVEAGLAEFALDEAFESGELDGVLTEWLGGHDHVYFPMHSDGPATAKILAVCRELHNAPKENLSPASLHDILPLIHEMRLFKSACEIALMKAAAKITASAHKRAMQFAHPGCYEYQLEAELHHEFAMAGARFPAYSTIVGGGDNACILHYTENQAQIKAGDLILIDAGAEYYGYASDITRTFPVSGVFSPAQKAVYNIVLKAQEAVLDRIGPGMTLSEAGDIAAEVITEGLLDLGLLTGSLSDNLNEQGYRRYFMHGIGHFLGLDVHDVGNYRLDGEERPLQPGMVITIEPGIYISADEDVADEYKGIGVRIEDNLVITATGAEVITQGVPKSVEAIEALMKKV
ncbi:Xaa-Pro aminopeptidase [Aestuariibacter sp. A3R04]|uniref:Xaa-Pro aminopeptidase n=1 Tax=Aestuariibacter sp. A3R04 TaxID=2841571 RepID=UPI001C0834D0|nr:Xaa-Pro aminopeptidase [Aestuariibacter sp. A3R04]MBU3021575.1 Xaa-Pro aminopeptidase [Aestuariibacter sp. A3R04]